MPAALKVFMASPVLNHTSGPQIRCISARGQRAYLSGQCLQADSEGMAQVI